MPNNTQHETTTATLTTSPGPPPRSLVLSMARRRGPAIPAESAMERQLCLRVVAAGVGKRMCAKTVEMWRASVVKWGSESPAALGCLLPIVRDAWGGARVTIVLDEEGAMISIGGDMEGREHEHEVEAGTLGEALVAALEAAPP